MVDTKYVMFDIFKFLIEAAPVHHFVNALLMVNSKGEIILMNYQAENIFGYQRNELLNQPILVLLPKRYRQEVRSDYFVREGNSMWLMGGGDLYGLRKDGTEFPAEIGFTAIEIDNEDFTLVSVLDITQRKRLEVSEYTLQQSEQVLLSELRHRVNNTLAIVQGIISQTFRGHENEGTEIIKGIMLNRIHSLSHAHSLLFDQNWAPVEIHNIIEGQVKMLDGSGDKITWSGPHIVISSNYAISLAMVIHELGTNAIKHGALTQEYGRIKIEWLNQDKHLLIKWIEKGGPSLIGTNKGLGMKLIKSGLPNSHTEFQILEDGFMYMMDVKLDT